MKQKKENHVLTFSNISRIGCCTALAAVLFLVGCSDKEGSGNSLEPDAANTQERLQDERKEQDSDRTQNTEEVLQEVLAMLPDRCVAEAEEQEFFKNLYKKEYGKADQTTVTETELIEFISGYYAEFYLADYYGVGDAFSYAALKDAWEAENASRQEKKQKGEIFYGPVEYELQDYFGYLYSNLKLKNIESIVLYADEALLAKGRAYYEENNETYDDLIGATCLLSDGERREERVFSYDDIQSLYKTNEAMLNFIMDAEIGDTMQYQNKDKMVTVELLSKEIDHKEFDEMQGVIMNDYVQREFYDAFVNEIAEAVPLVMAQEYGG